MKYFRHKNYFISLNARRLRKIFIKIQLFLQIDISKNMSYEIKKGHDWFSITHKASKFLIEKEPEFKKHFSRAFCPSEFFTQTLLYNSDFKKNIYNLDDENIGSQRYIDWKRGSPYIFKQEDLELLKNNKMMYARKFMESEDIDIINSLYDYLILQNK